MDLFDPQRLPPLPVTLEEAHREIRYLQRKLYIERQQLATNVVEREKDRRAAKGNIRMTPIFADILLNPNDAGLKIQRMVEDTLKPIVRAAMNDGVSLNDLELMLGISVEWVVFKERLDQHVHMKRNKAAQTPEGPSGFELADESS